MAESITVNGLTTYRPGTYGQPDVSALGGIVTETNILAVIADLPFLQAATPATYATQSALKAVDPTNDVLQRIAHLIYSAGARDSRVKVPSTVVLCNAQPCTQAIKTLDDAAAADSLTLSSVLWGPAGNNVHVDCVDGTGLTPAFTGRRLTVTRSGVPTWTEDVEQENIATFNYTGADAATMALAFAPTTGLTIAYTDTLLALGTFATPDYPFDGLITFTPSTAPVASNDFTATISGTNKATGLADTEVVTWLSGGGAGATPSTKTWSAITSIVFAEAGGPAQTPTFTIAGNSFDLTATGVGSAYPTADSLATRVNTFANFTATNNSAEAAGIFTDELDTFTSATIKAAAKSLLAETRACQAAFNRSGLVTAARAAGAGTSPPDYSGITATNAGYLSGGTATATADADVTTALTALESEDVNVVAAPGYTAASRHTLVGLHCETMAGSGQNERNAHVGAASSRALATLKADVVTQNARHLNLWFQHFDVYDHKGVLTQLDPSWLALMGGAMQAGTPACTPLTRKLPNVVAVYNNANFNVDQQANVLIKYGLTAVTTHRRNGLQVERSVTTYKTDDNPIYSEMSANESLNLSIRDLRNALDIIVGDPGFVSTAPRLQSIANARLRRQANQNDLALIKSFASVTIEDLGAAFRVTYSMAAVEPINFLIINPRVERQPVSSLSV